MNTITEPPMGVRLRYKLFGMRVPEEYREWVYHDVMSPTWLRQEALRRSWIAGTVYAVLTLIRGGELDDIFIIATMLLAPAFVSLWYLSANADRARKEMLDRQAGRSSQPQITKQTFYWMFGGLVLAGVIYALFEVL
jgi:hypothetical protein